MAPYTVGFVGTTAPHSFLFLDTLRLLPDTVGEIVLVEADPARVQRAGVAKVHGDLDAMLAAERPDVCFVMVPTNEVEAPAVRCAEAGIPLVIDKHVAHPSAAIRRILAACRRGGVTMSTCYTWRYSPAVRDIRRWVGQGAIGRPYCFDIRMVTTSAEVRTADPQFAWLFERERSGGGILIWLGCHFIDLIRFIFGREVVAVSALTSRLTDVPSDVEDVASVSLLLEDGIVGSLHCAYVMPGGLAEAYHTSFHLWGDRGDVAWTPVFSAPPTVRVRSVCADWAAAPERSFAYEEKAAPTAYCGKEYIVDYFRDMIRRLVAGQAPAVTGEDALRVVEICEAAYESAETGRRVELARG